jgi:hypothetical protein
MPAVILLYGTVQCMVYSVVADEIASKGLCSFNVPRSEYVCDEIAEARLYRLFDICAASMPRDLDTPERMLKWEGLYE